MRALRILLLGLLLTVGMTVVGASASAEDHDEETSAYSRTGPYGSFSGAYAFEDWNQSNNETPADDTFGFNLRLGARISEWVAVELQLEYFDDFFPDDRPDYSTVSVFANTRVYPLSGRLQPYAIGGLGIISTVVDHREPGSSYGRSTADWGFRFGAGVDFYYTDHIALTVEGAYILTVGEVKDTDHVSMGVGILYRF